jgi:hypothetical protein
MKRRLNWLVCLLTLQISGCVSNPLKARSESVPPQIQCPSNLCQYPSDQDLRAARQRLQTQLDQLNQLYPESPSTLSSSGTTSK